MKFGVVIFPGSNCDQDMIYVLRDVMKQEVVELWHKDHDLQGVDFVVLPGGFSFGDYLRSGAIARFSPIMTEVIEFAKNGGYVFGVCNGFQVLCEAGLLPGALLHNDNQKFICKNVNIRCETSNSMVTNQIESGKALKIPIAHGEGRFHADAEELAEIQANDQVLFRYCDENGKLDEAFNPNGSISNIAGVTNKERNVFGMMPHPERAADENLGNLDGKALFESILAGVSAWYVFHGLDHGKYGIDQTQISLNQIQNSLDQTSNADAYRKRWLDYCLNFYDGARSDDDHGMVTLVRSLYNDVLTLS